MERWRTRAPSSKAGWTRCSWRTTVTRPLPPGAGRRRRWPAWRRAPAEREQPGGALVSRGLADALVVWGPATGQATPLADVKRVRGAVPDVPLLVGSGVTPETVAELLSVADGAIVGTAVKRDGDVRNPVDRARVERLVAAAGRR